MTNLFYFYAELFNLSNLSQLQLIIPPKLGRRLAEPYVDASGREDGTVQSHIRELGVTDITVRNELKGSNLALHLTNEAESAAYDSAFDKMVVKASTYTPERHFFPRRVFDPFQVGTLKWEQRSVSATSGIIIRQPNVFAYYDFNNSVA